MKAIQHWTVVVRQNIGEEINMVSKMRQTFLTKTKMRDLTFVLPVRKHNHWQLGCVLSLHFWCVLGLFYVPALSKGLRCKNTVAREAHSWNHGAWLRRGHLIQDSVQRPIMNTDFNKLWVIWGEVGGGTIKPMAWRSMLSHRSSFWCHSNTRQLIHQMLRSLKPDLMGCHGSFGCWHTLALSCS